MSFATHPVFGRRIRVPVNSQRPTGCALKFVAVKGVATYFPLAASTSILTYYLAIEAQMCQNDAMFSPDRRTKSIACPARSSDRPFPSRIPNTRAAAIETTNYPTRFREFIDRSIAIENRELSPRVVTSRTFEGSS